MADELKHSTTISKKDESFPAYLDFDKLRSEGIDYLGKLAGQIWTDHNVHDPGITILEMLCYALLDLGYRTQLPLEDILARNPDETSPDNNFFTPAQILACNPLTITDFRKLLIDIKEVRNAWLEPATDICRSVNLSEDSEENRMSVKCESFLNGLYHVYLDLERDIYSYGGESDFKDKDEACDYRESVICKVKETLMAHRNFCEDFADIRILCKLPMGVCAEIELEDAAKAEEVYLSVVEALRNFFTPAPRFYTLQQLLDKQKSMEEIFAGRPYDITQSHGFVDTEEFETIKLKKEIHTSDVYNVLFNVPGVRSVHNLSLRTCDGTFETSDWKFRIKENHIPEFSARCSGFRFMRNGMPLPVDVEKYQGLFDLNFSHSGKVLYESPSPYLDLEIPEGSYRTDLTDYYSIQNEFPRVYAIEEGGLADNAPDERKAQALQLKGYLLFFDQLLANYLTQLGNLRSLFALSSPGDEKQQHTYFTNQLTTVPELQKLLRFPDTENGVHAGLGAEGNTLVFPVDKNKLRLLKESDQLKYFDLEQAKPVAFESQAGKDTEVSQLKNDLYHDKLIHLEFITKPDGCVFYYILTSSENIALISKKYFKSVDEAKEHAASVKYIGAFDENYRSFVDSNHHFSFTIDMNLASFAEYLQLLVEDRARYLERRQDFLQHLLARFAETFTDYALLSFGNITNEQIEESKIKATERFLTNYDDISSNRGKGFDYMTDGWHNDNISGFEKRVKSLSGIEDWKRRSLCNFEVNRYDEQYVSHLEIAGRVFFRIHELYDSPKEAEQATKAFFTTLSDRERYGVQPVPREQAWNIIIREDAQTLATYPQKYETEEEARTAMRHLHRLLSGNPSSPKDIFAGDFIYFLQLKDYKGDVVHTSAKHYDTEAIAKSVLVQIKQGINDEDRWQTEEDSPARTGTLFRIPHRRQTPRFIDLDAFNIDIDDMPAGESETFSYDLREARNRFKFRPFEEFNSFKQARKHWQQLLAWMTDAENYSIRPEKDTDSFSLYIAVDDEDKAVCSEEFKNEKEAWDGLNKILSIIRQNIYALTIKKVPNRWKFSFRLGIEQTEPFTFESLEDYGTREEALAAATGFQKSISTLQVRKYKEEGEFRLVPIKPPEETSSVRLTQTFEPDESASLREALNREVSMQQEVNRLLKEPGVKAFAGGVDLDHLSKQGLYVYRLIDRDTIPACFSKSFANRGSAEKILKSLRKVNCDKYSALEICLGGKNVINKRIDDTTGAAWYHYLIRSRNRFGGSGDEPVLFESVKGYRTAEEAEKAFRENYLQILEWASQAKKYGSKISVEEKLVHKSFDSSDNEAVAFIPQAIRDEWGAETQKKLITLARRHPIRVVDRNSDKFYTLFPCEEKPAKQRERVCQPDEENPVYYFRLYGSGYDEAEKENPHWQSTGYFNTPEETRRGYRFFRMLLCYPGNFFVRCDPCKPDKSPDKDQKQKKEGDKYRICLREVLAESTARFSSEEAAWGKEGVQKFICVSQSERAFHPYWREGDGCYTFYLACADSIVYHPCHYDTPKERDHAIERLYREVRKRYESRAWQLKENQKEKKHILLNEAGEPFATVPFRDQYEGCEGWIIFFSNVLRNQIQYATDDNGLFYAYDDESGITVHASHDVDEAAWKKTLEAFACYFPIVKRRDEKTGKYEYCIEIKLPGFSYCGETPDEDKPCGCNGKETQAEPECYIAWKSRCCFTSCKEAQAVWRNIIKLLMQYKNYRPLFDCDCYDFSIALHYSKQEGVPEIVSRGAGLSLGAGEMVALNPQCYANPDEVCAAIERSWELINAEGLHVAEHILLRPDCAGDNDRKEYQLNDCENKTGCEFEWSEPDNDPCVDRPDVCFVPGADPYSFIATVALPAWPARFRKPENRRLMEQLLYREAPAHVLLRILWLAPHDFCCFERKYQQWGRWLGCNDSCLEEFSQRDFLEFLFSRNYECLDDCDVCECRDNNQEAETDFCLETWSEESMSNPYEFLNQVNNLYCWREQHCEEYQFTPCEKVVIEDDDEGDNATILTHRIVEERGEETEEHPAQPLKSKSQVVNRRMARYRSAVDKMVEDTNHPLAQKAKAFVADPQPEPERTANLLIEIAQNEKPSDRKALTKSQAGNLLQSVLCYYLDKVCFNGNDLANIEALQPAIKAIDEAKADLKAIYNHWEPEQVKLYEAETDLVAIRRILTGEEEANT